MNKKFLAALLLLSAFSFHPSAFGQTQSGIVRTVARPDAPSQRLQGVVVRAQGEYNPVMTDEQGAFQLLMPGQKNGTPYTLAGINKGGYELREPELIGRQLPFSSSVPLEIIMVSRRQLQRDKQRIEQAARENIERYYEEQLNALNEQLAQARLSNQEYEQQLSRLEQEYDRFEPLIEQMAERYARTDYNGMSAADSLIQQAIEQGDLQLAQERILAKGDPAEREKKIKRIRRLAEAQRDELAEDYYHLHSIHLSRLENDSALYYLIKRAELDTTNAQWQLDAGFFCGKMSIHYKDALMLFRRALRYAQANEGPNALRVAVARNNIAFTLARMGKYQEALSEQRVALDLYSRLYGEKHQRTAARMTNLGAIHYYMGNVDSAQYWFDEAEKLYSAIGGTTEDPYELALIHSELLNNQASIDANQGNFESAFARLNKALNIVPKDAERLQITLLCTMGDVYLMSKKMDEARSSWRQALEKAQRVYGEDHPITKELQKNLQ